MNVELLLVLALLATCVGLFVVNKPRMDVVAVLAMVALPLTGVISINEALAGFSDPSVVLIAALFVIATVWYGPASPSASATGWYARQAAVKPAC